jgi:hypothetical protein
MIFCRGARSSLGPYDWPINPGKDGGLLKGSRTHRLRSAAHPRSTERRAAPLGAADAQHQPAYSSVKLIHETEGPHRQKSALR